MNFRFAKFYTKASTNVDTIKIFQYLAFLNRILLFYPKITNFGPIQLGIIAYISSNVKNYPCAKFYAFIKK